MQALGEYCYTINLWHLYNLSSNIMRIVLYDAQRINPEIANSKLLSRVYGICDCLWQCLDGYCFCKYRFVLFRGGNRLKTTPTVAESNVRVTFSLCWMVKSSLEFLLMFKYFDNPGRHTSRGVWARALGMRLKALFKPVAS
jgi:hypothetical protein